MIRDIATYWSQMEESCTKTVNHEVDEVHSQYRDSPLSSGDPPVYTSITFADREASQRAAAEKATEVALAELYAHVAAMPSSSKKRRLLKQFNRASAVAQASSSPMITHDKHKHPGLLTDSNKVG